MCRGRWPSQSVAYVRPCSLYHIVHDVAGGLSYVLSDALRLRLVNSLLTKLRFWRRFMMWWAGLRGAMAFALAVDAADEYGKVGEVMKV